VAQQDSNDLKKEVASSENQGWIFYDVY
jgi:hypothetical protein